jgi:hypothetical protein
MDNKTKRRMIRKYFKLFPKWAIWMIVIGVVVLGVPNLGVLGLGVLDLPRELNALTAYANPKIVGLVFVGIGFLGIFSYALGKPTDQQMDEWLEEDMEDLKKKALNKMGIDEAELVSEPVIITGPRLWDIAGADVLSKKGKDDILRFTPISVSIINFAQNQLLAYACVFDFTTGNTLNESTDEYFYKDVVSVSTKSESKLVRIPRKGTIHLNAAETFTLTTTGGTSASVLLRDPKLIEKMGGGEIPTTRAEKAILAMRKMLREKKT